MKPDQFKLRPIRAPQLDNGMLEKAIIRLDKLTEGMDGAIIDSPDLLNEFRVQLRTGLLRGETFEESTRGKRREWLLLSLYLNDLTTAESRAWLPAMENDVAISILGKYSDNLASKKHLLRKATQLYFTHYGVDRLPCLNWLCWMLRLAWSAISTDLLDPVSKTWSENAGVLFATDAPDKVAESWQPGSSVEELADRFHIHKGGLFRERLLESLILCRLRKIPLKEQDQDLSNLVIAEKERRLSSGLPLGAEAVKILIHRSRHENSSRVPDAWKEDVVNFACDLRIPNSELQSRWWGWATSCEKDVAIRALSELSLQAFIQLLAHSLQGTDAEHQFPARSKMLLNLFKIGKIIDARLIIHKDLNYRLDSKTKNVLRPSWVSGGPQHTSFICLRCVDNVYLIEGTHSFALRAFIGPDSFPVNAFWISGPRFYYDSEFRINEYSCPIYQRHQGDWVSKFQEKLRHYHIEWRGLALHHESIYSL